jgi:hypothetical protein
MISTATVMSIRKQNIFLLVITDPIAATFGFDQISRFAA